MIRTIVADPAWMEKGAGKVKRGADRHYRLMTTDQNIALMKEWLAEQELSDDLHFYLWVTNTFLPDGLRVIDELGFRYITNICWAKDSFGLGYYFRGQHELCLFATRGRGAALKKPDNAVSSLIQAKKRKHSQKPEAFYELVERRSVGDYFYMFSRSQPRIGWTMKGDEQGSL